MSRPRTAPLPVALLLLASLVLALPGPADARVPKGGAERILRDLKSKKARTRLRAAYAAGRHRVEGTAAGVREALQDPHPNVRATACAAVAQLKDQEARPGLVKLLRARSANERRAAEEALRALDRAAGSPHLLVAVGPTGLPPGAPAALGPWLSQTLATTLAASEGVLLSAGEEQVLKGRRLTAHLKRRGLSGLLVSPAVQDLSIVPDGERFVVHAKVGLVAATLVEQAVRVMTNAQAHVGAPLSLRTAERIDTLYRKVLQAAAGSALEGVLGEARTKARRRR